MAEKKAFPIWRPNVRERNFTNNIFFLLNGRRPAEYLPHYSQHAICWQEYQDIVHSCFVSVKSALSLFIQFSPIIFLEYAFLSMMELKMNSCWIYWFGYWKCLSMRIPSDTSYPSKRKLFASVVALYGRQSWLANVILQLLFPKINFCQLFHGHPPYG